MIREGHSRLADKHRIREALRIVYGVVAWAAIMALLVG